MCTQTDFVRLVPYYLQERSKNAQVPGSASDATTAPYVAQLSYTDQLEAFISRYKRRPADIKHWPYGPYWPGHFKGLLLNTPRHLAVGLRGPEPLAVGEFARHLLANSQTAETQVTQYPGKWRGVQVAYDSDRSPRDFNPLPVPDGCCPTLMFESRFECGNLRQARRVGQFEYELLLKPDLYTARHTQWYYFRVTNSEPGLTYKLRIINLLKKDSLYNQGMRPLLYSEQDARERQRGWVRAGHHISYTRSSPGTNCSLLETNTTYYTLEWQMELPNHKDTYYLAHCYPYTFTDLKEDLELLMNSDERSKVTQREVMCETRAGNSCFLLTITNFDSRAEKKAVIITARVHPGESQSSWMMKGLLEFITGPDPAARELRNKFVFKVVPMINPDGVIVGNYRCSLVGRDLNRNYRHPRRDSFPTVWHVKNMVQQVASKYEVVLYCDLHGHSRKPNVFMYGNNTSADQAVTPQDMARAFISERLFPWIMSVKSPDKFHFGSCKFQIRRCKESTGRVVMWRQLRIPNSFTMEATFSGTVLDRDNHRHFNTHDFMEMGKVLTQAVLEHQTVRDDPVQHTRTVLDLTRCLTEQYLTCKGVLESNTALPNMVYQGNSKNGETNKQVLAPDASLALDKNSNIIQDDLLSANDKTRLGERSLQDISAREDNLPATVLSRDELVHIVQKLAAGRTMDDCVELLAHLDIQNNLQESDSSDSDSESEPEMRLPEPKAKKKRKKSKKQRDRESERKTAAQEDEKKGRVGRAKSALPALSAATCRPEEDNSVCSDLWHTKQVNGEAQRTRQRLPGFVSKFEGRHNGGFPCFTQERSLERAAKRLADHKDKHIDGQTSENSASGADEGELLVNGHRHGVLGSASHASPAHLESRVKTGYTHAGNLQERYTNKFEPWEEARGHWKYTHSAQGHHHSNGHQNPRSGDCNDIIAETLGPDNGLKMALAAGRTPYHQEHPRGGSVLESPFVQHSYVSPHPSWPAGAAASSPVPSLSTSCNRITYTDISSLFTAGTCTSSTSGNNHNSPVTANTLSGRSSDALSSSAQTTSSSTTRRLQQTSKSKFRHGQSCVDSTSSSDNIKEKQGNDMRATCHLPPARDGNTQTDDDTVTAVFYDSGSAPGQWRNVPRTYIRKEKFNVRQLVNNLEHNLTGVIFHSQTFRSLPSHNHSSTSRGHRPVVSHQVAHTSLPAMTGLAPSTQAVVTDTRTSNTQDKITGGSALSGQSEEHP
ncbi:hypothetical protein BsWGS_24568 [Bradybaena similaris]